MSIITFGPFRFDTTQNSLWQDGELLNVAPKALAVLAKLIEHAGQPVSKDDILSAVWPDVVVSESVLTVRIRALRKVLGDSSHAPEYIETLHRYGYRFIAATEPDNSMPDTAQSTTVEPVAQWPQTWPKSSESSTTFTGRALELAALQQCWQRCQRGERQLMFITGESGLGKTRLVETFLKQLTDSPCRLALGQCIGQTTLAEPYLPLLDALEYLCRHTDNNVLPMQQLAHYAPNWWSQLPTPLTHNYPLETATPRKITAERMLRELADALEVLTAQQPLVVVLEDLHWSDNATLDALNWLARRRGPAALMIIATYRPIEVILQQHPLRRLKQELSLHKLCQELALELFSLAEVVQFVKQYWPQPQTELIAWLYDYTEGHPLFLASVIDELIAQKQEQVIDVARLSRVIPDNLNEMINMKLLHCSAEQQQLLSVASVLGVEFSARLLALMLNEPLEQVEDRCAELIQHGQFLVEAPTEEVYIVENELLSTRYRFRHALYHQVVYEQLSQHQCSRWHRQVVPHLQTYYGEYSQHHSTELALHCERGQLWPDTVHYLYLAGEQALHRGAHREALQFLQHAADLLERVSAEQREPLPVLELYTGLAHALMSLRGQADPAVEQVLQQAQTLSEQLGDSPQLFWVLVGMRKHYVGRGQHTAARQIAEQCLQRAQNLADPVLQMEAHYDVGNVLFWLGEINLAEQQLQHSIALHSPARFIELRAQVDLAPVVGSHIYLGLIKWLQGHAEQALKHSTQAIELAEALDHDYGVTLACMYAAKLHHLRGDPAATLQYAERAIELAQQGGFLIWEFNSRFQQGWSWFEQGQHAKGIATMQHALQVHQDSNEVVEQPFLMGYLAAALAHMKQLDDAESLLQQALTLMHHNSEYWYAAELYRLQGELHLQREDFPAAEVALQQALKLAQDQGAQAWESRILDSLKGLESTQGF